MKRDPLPSMALAAPVTTAAAPQWSVALPLLAGALLIIAALFYETAAGIVRIWAHSETFAHGFVVAPISLWLIWRMRARLRTLELRPSWLALPLLAAAGFVWLVGNVGAVNAVSQFAFVAMLVLAVPAILGIEITRAMLFPLGFLFFCVPLGAFLLPTLMVHTADFTIGALRATGVPVYREGMQFMVPNGRWSIVEACSGVRYLIASLVVGTLFAYLNYTTLWRRLVFVGISIVVPIIANWIRAYMIVMLGYLSNNRIATGVDHIVYGWLFFGVVMLIMFMIGARWRQPRSIASMPSSLTGAQTVPATRVIAGVTLAEGTRAEPGVSSGVKVLCTASSSALQIAILAVLAVTAIWPLANWAIARHASDSAVTLRVIEVPGWQAMAAPAEGFTPHFVRFSAAQHEILRQGDRQVGLYVAYYRGQDFEHKLVTSDNALLLPEDKLWHTIASGPRALDLEGTTVPVRAAQVLGEGGQTIEAWQWYWINGALTSSDMFAKARVAWLKITGRGDDSAVVVVYTPAGADTQPDATLQGFVRDSWPAIAAALSGVREGER